MSDYTPDLRRVKAIYTDHETECLRSVVPLDQAKSHACSGFDRFIAKVKADALRGMGQWFETASQCGTGERDAIAAQACFDRADRIEGEA